MADSSSVSQVVIHDIGLLAQALYSSRHLQYVVLIVLGFTIFGYFVDNYGSSDPREPPVLRPSFPLFGHLMGMFAKHTQFYDDLYKKNGMAIATLPMLGGKMYAVWDTALIQSGLRAKTMSFDAIMCQHAQGLLGLQDRSVDLARDGMLADLMHVTKPILAGEALARINVTVLNHAAIVLDKIRKEKTYEVRDLYDWVVTTATLATTEALYGAANPLHRDRSLLDDVWSFESGLRRLALNILPSVIAPREHQARERLVAAIAPLFDETLNHGIELPDLTRRRVEVIRSHGITDPIEIARVELALLHGATVNTVPSLFWTLAHVFAHPELVTAIRNEALPLVKFTSTSPDGEKEGHFPIKLLDSACPLLLSSYQEVTRLANKAMSTRHVMEDTLLTDAHGREYLVRAGSTVVMPATAHSAANVWGPDVDTFKPYRFLDWSEKAAREQRHAAYMPFGGGKHLCPGRNLAKAEILGLVVALALAFEMEDAANPPGRPITVPKIEPARLGQGVGKTVGLKMGKKLAVRFRTREGWEDVRWKFVL